MLRKGRWAAYLGLAWLALRLIRLLLRTLGYRRAVRVLVLLSPDPKREGYTGQMPVAARAIERVDGWWPYQSRGCLRRSLLFWWLFRWLGYKTDIRTGVRRDGESYELHAWVQCRGIILNDKAGKVSKYADVWNELSANVIEAEGKK